MGFPILSINLAVGIREEFLTALGRVFRMDPMGKPVSKHGKHGGFHRTGDGDREIMVVIETTGGLKTTNAYESVPIGHNQYTHVELPYLIKVPKIREIIYCADGLGAGETYLIRRNKILSSVWAGGVFCDESSLSVINERGEIDQFRWALVLEPYRKD